MWRTEEMANGVLQMMPLNVTDGVRRLFGAAIELLSAAFSC